MKAYDLKVLIEKLKSRGLDVTEETAKGVFEDTFSWVEESAKISENKIDDMIVGMAGPAKSYVMEMLDKIDGKVG